MASKSSVTVGALPAEAIRSPREMSMSSASSSVTDWPAAASASSPSIVSIFVTVERRPDGSTTISSPGLTVPAATRPA